jgi:8-oxo-dGTP diphosphatase
VHRPRYDDWSFPKGKRDGKEDDEQAALREVEEETGFQCVLGPDLGVVEYRDALGRHKTVHYWVMELAEAEDGERFQPNREVDELRWCRPRVAGRLLTYEHDRALMERFERARA